MRGPPIINLQVMEIGKSYDVLTTQLSSTPCNQKVNPDCIINKTDNDSANYSLFDIDMTVDFGEIQQEGSLEPISEEIFDNKYLAEILNVESPLKRKREDSEINFTELVPKLETNITVTPLVHKKKKRRLSITPHLVDMLKTPLSLFTPKRRQSIATSTISNTLSLKKPPPHCILSTSGAFNVSPSESLGNLSISTNCCSTPIPENITEFHLKKPGKKSRMKYRKKLSKSKLAQEESATLEIAENDEINKYIEYSGPNAIQTNLTTKFKPQTDLNLTGLDSLLVDNCEERDDLHTPTAAIKTGVSRPTTPQTVPRIIVSNQTAGYKPEAVKKALNLSKRHSICVVESDRENLYANIHSIRSRSSSPISRQLSPTREQPDATPKTNCWRLHPNHSVLTSFSSISFPISKSLKL